MVQPEGGALKHADGLLQSPLIYIVDPLETCHEEVASEPLVELLHGQVREQMIVGGGKDNFTDKILGEAYAEKIELRFLCNLVPPVLHPPPGTVDNVVVCLTRASKRWNGIFIMHAL